MFRKEKRLPESEGVTREIALPIAPMSSGDQSKPIPTMDTSSNSPMTETPLSLDEELSELYRTNAEAMFRYGLLLTRNGSLAQDAVHETFVKYCVQRRQGELTDDRAWLFRVMRNYILDAQKSLSSRLSVGLEAASGCSDPTNSPQQALEYSEVLQQVMKILSPRELQCVQLRAEGFSYKEIATILGIVPGTVGTLLTRSSEKIRKALGKDGLPCDAL